MYKLWVDCGIFRSHSPLAYVMLPSTYFVTYFNFKSKTFLRYWQYGHWEPPLPQRLHQVNKSFLWQTFCNCDKTLRIEKWDRQLVESDSFGNSAILCTVYIVSWTQDGRKWHLWQVCTVYIQSKSFFKCCNHSNCVLLRQMSGTSKWKYWKISQVFEWNNTCIKIWSSRWMQDSIQFNSIQFNSIQFNSIQFNSIQFQLIFFIKKHNRTQDKEQMKEVQRGAKFGKSWDPFYKNRYT